MEQLMNGKKQYLEKEYNELKVIDKSKFIKVYQYKSFNYIWIDGYTYLYPVRVVFREI